MMISLLRSIFSCSHEKMTFPQTDMKTGSTTCSCLSCGKRMPYDWASMRLIDTLRHPPATVVDNLMRSRPVSPHE